MNRLVQYSVADKVATIRMDDGKVNVMTLPMMEALSEAFDRAQRDRLVVVLTGRAHVFSAGFDLNVLRGADVEQHWRMLNAGAELALRLMAFPTPVIAACNGHALPMGAFLMLASDVRIGANGPFGIGLNEVAIGMTVPLFAIELARQRLTPAYFNRGLMTGERYVPEEAMRAGYLDIVVEQEELQERAQATAAMLTGIDFQAHAETKLKARKPALLAVRSAIDQELVLEKFERAHAQRAST